jgi:hypothetical protein
MSAATYSGDLAFSGEINDERTQARGPGLFSRFVAALHRSRELQAAREIERHRHLIDARKNAQSAWTF